MNTSDRNDRALRIQSSSDESQQMLRELEKALARAFRFTRRERQVLRQIVDGASVEIISRSLEIRDTSVHKHMHRIFAKTRTEGRSPLIKLGLRLAARRRIFAPSLLAA